jgi:hypothetical protein
LFALGTLGAGIKTSPDQRYVNVLLMLGMVVIAVMIGFRVQVGGDWDAYVNIFRYSGRLSLESTLQLSDPGYRVINRTVRLAGGEFYVVDLICGSIFSWGLYRFAKAQPDPWLAVLVAIPYLVIVVAMGYTRQSVAIGILMAGLAGLLQGGSFWRFLLYVAFASLFHSSALIVLPLAVIGMKRNRFAQAVVIPAVVLGAYATLFSQNVDQFVDHYITKSMSSQGAMIRIALCLLPALILLRARDRLRFTPTEYVLWRNFAFAAIACVPLLLVVPSTAVDRIALYILPIQIAVFARLHFLTGNVARARGIVIALSCAIQFTWLNFAATADRWVPYQIGAEPAQLREEHRGISRGS